MWMIFFSSLKVKTMLNIRFTYEKEENNKLPFLDVLINTANNEIGTSVFGKKTDTGLLTNFFSFTPYKYKVGLINTLVDRIFKVTSSWCDLHSDLNHLKVILQKNSFALNVIDHVVNRYLNFKCSNESNVKKHEDTCRYYIINYHLWEHFHCMHKRDLTMQSNERR